MVNELDGRFINKPKEVFLGEMKSSIKPVNLTIPLVILALFLFLLDIVYRRLNLDLWTYINKINLKINKNHTNKKVKRAVIERDVKINEKQDSIKTDNKENTQVKHQKRAEKNKKDKTEILDTSALLKNKNKR